MSLEFNIFLCIVFSAAVTGRNTRIIGGVKADSKEFPYHASIRRISDNEQVCGGAIITNRHVLTTAHCIDSKYVAKESIMVAVGFSRKSSLSGFLYTPLFINLHPEYTGKPNPSTMRLNDIAVITTQELILFTDFVSWIDLPEIDIVNKDIAIVSGWGSMENPPNTKKSEMRSTWMSVLDMNHCGRKLPFPIYADQFCAFQRPGVGVCLGDGGSPMVSNAKLIGLVLASRAYATGEPEIYVNVFAHLDFINLIITML